MPKLCSPIPAEIVFLFEQYIFKSDEKKIDLQLINSSLLSLTQYSQHLLD